MRQKKKKTKNYHKESIHPSIHDAATHYSRCCLFRSRRYGSVVLYRLFAASGWLWLCKSIYPFHPYPGASSTTHSPLSSTTHFPIIISSRSSQKTTQVCSPDYSTVSYCQPGLDPEVVDSQYCDYGDCWADRFNGFCTYGVSQKNAARGPTDCTQVNPEGGYVCSEDYTTLVSFFIFFYFLFFIFFAFADGFCVFFL